MQVELTGKRSNDTVKLFGIQFKDGKAELNKDQVRKNVLGKLLARYYPVVESGTVVEAETGKEPVKRRKNRYIDSSS